MSRNLKIISLIICIVIGIGYYLNLIEDYKYNKQYSPDGQYSIYASRFKYEKYISSWIPSTKYSDGSGKLFLYDELEDKLIGSTNIDMLSNINELKWFETKISNKSSYNSISLELPRKISKSIIEDYNKTIPVKKKGYIFHSSGKMYKLSYDEKTSYYTVKNSLDQPIMDSLYYFSKANQNYQVINKHFKIDYYDANMQKTTPNNEPLFLEVCGNELEFSYKIVEDDSYYLVKASESFGYSFDNYKTIDSIIKQSNLKALYFANGKQKIEDTNPQVASIIIQYDSHYEIRNNKSSTFYNHVNIDTYPITVTRDSLIGYYNLSAINYKQLDTFQYNLAPVLFKDNTTGFIDVHGNEYKKSSRSNK